MGTKMRWNGGNKNLVSFSSDGMRDRRISRSPNGHFYRADAEGGYIFLPKSTTRFNSKLYSIWSTLDTWTLSLSKYAFLIHGFYLLGLFTAKQHSVEPFVISHVFIAP